MKLKISLLAFLTLFNYTAYAAGDEDNLGKRRPSEENNNPSKRVCVEEENNNVINHDLYFFNQEIEFNDEDDYSSDDEDADEDAATNVNKDRFIHPCAENLYDKITLQQKEKELIEEIEAINNTFRSQEIDELQRRKKIIEAVSKKFNADFLLQHFNYNQNEDHTTYDKNNFRDDAYDPSEAPSYCYANNIIEHISRYEFFSINKIGESNIILHVKDFNRYLQYFPWIKSIRVYFDHHIKHIGRMAKATTSLNAFDNISTLKNIESIIILSSGINPEDKHPDWVKELNCLNNDKDDNEDNDSENDGYIDIGIDIDIGD